jgi:hypothetical protein
VRKTISTLHFLFSRNNTSCRNFCPFNLDYHWIGSRTSHRIVAILKLHHAYTFAFKSWFFCVKNVLCYKNINIVITIVIRLTFWNPVVSFIGDNFTLTIARNIADDENTIFGGEKKKKKTRWKIAWYSQPRVGYMRYSSSWSLEEKRCCKFCLGCRMIWSEQKINHY